MVFLASVCQFMGARDSSKVARGGWSVDLSHPSDSLSPPVCCSQRTLTRRDVDHICRFIAFVGERTQRKPVFKRLYPSISIAVGLNAHAVWLIRYLFSFPISFYSTALEVSYHWRSVWVQYDCWEFYWLLTTSALSVVKLKCRLIHLCPLVTTRRCIKS